MNLFNVGTMKEETFMKAKRLKERIEQCNSLIQQLRKSSQVLSHTSNEGLPDFLAALNEMTNGDYLLNEIVDEVISRYQKNIQKYEEEFSEL